MTSNETRFWSGLTPVGECLIWTKAQNGAGYGKMWWNGRLQFVHRISYEMHVGPIPAGKVLDHLCRNRACVCPAHLEAVTQQQNMLRGTGMSARHAKKPCCPTCGAAYALKYNGQRFCNDCRNRQRRRSPEPRKFSRPRPVVI